MGAATAKFLTEEDRGESPHFPLRQQERWETNGKTAAPEIHPSEHFRLAISKKISLGDIAKAAGISRAAASYALRNKPGVSAVTRQRVLQISRQMGYIPDARMTSWMEMVRMTKTKHMLPIVWLHKSIDRLSGEDGAGRAYLTGAQARAIELGYRIEEIGVTDSEMTSDRIAQMIYQRGIEGIIVASSDAHFRPDWNHLAGVALEGGLQTPRLPRFLPDLSSNLLLAIEMVRRAGHGRIGICCEEPSDSQIRYILHSAVSYLHSSSSRTDRVRPLFFPRESDRFLTMRVSEWLKREKPEVMIGDSRHLIKWAEAAGFAVPKDIGIVHIAKDDDLSDWAGICDHKREIGAAAVEAVISRIQRRLFGIPSVPADTLIRGSWSAGRTLLQRSS